MSGMLVRVQPPDIAALRRDARERALARPRWPFDGTVSEGVAGAAAVATRRYLPARPAPGGAAVVFLHGGFGLFGDLELQDGYCRRIAGALHVVVLSVAYRLAPEATLAESAADAVAAAELLRADGLSRVVLWGDSAGGTVALAAARDARADALVLTNPNVDLTLASYDDTAPGGPGRALSEWSFARWAGGGTLADAPDFAAGARGLPPVYLAVGADDSLLADADRLITARADAGVPARLRIVPGAAHGFMGGPDLAVAEDVIAEAGRFHDF
ncbi:alpha/beta hydrolase [Leifsonia sp. NPDC056824]|uniref:alpha/beta hydrolase n=1 Tax=Leifsonia sp. NPDC056824 TaxID=3345953 RepID=UPI0036CACACA